MMALTVAAVGDVIPKERTGAAMGLLGTVSAIGTALGPIIGGLLLSWLGWRALFGVMTLAGIATLCAGHASLPPSRATQNRGLADFDWIGTLLLAASLGAAALATTLGVASSVTLTVALAVLAALVFAGFLVVETRATAPLLRLSLLRERGIGVSLLTTAIVSAIVMTTLVAGPFFLTRTLGLGVAAAGGAMSVGPLVAALVGFPAGHLVDRIGAAGTSIAGLAGVTVGSLLMVVLPGPLAVLGYVIALAILTAGYALFQAATTTAIMAGAASDQRGVTSALLGLSRNVGLITGASAMGTVFAVATASGFGPFPPGGDVGLATAFAIAAIFAALAAGLTLRQTIAARAGRSP
jgi:MFS family permease